MLTAVSVCCTGDHSELELSGSLSLSSEAAPQVLERSEQHPVQPRTLNMGQMRRHDILWGLIHKPVQVLALMRLQLRCLHSGLEALLQLPFIAQVYAPIGQQHSLRKPAARPGSTKSAAADAAHMSACSGAVLAAAVGIGVLSALETERRLQDGSACSSPINRHDDAAHALWRDPHHAQRSMLGSRAYAGGGRLVGSHAAQQRDRESPGRQLRHSKESLQSLPRTDDAIAGGVHSLASAEEQEGRSIFWMHRLPAYRARMREICGGPSADADLDADLTKTGPREQDHASAP